jgi:hypothetical protein
VPEKAPDIVEAFLKSSSPRNIVKSFELAGISLVRDDASNIFTKVASAQLCVIESMEKVTRT